MANEAGLPEPLVPIDPKDPCSEMRPPTASEWSDPNVDIHGWSSPHENPGYGDVISDGKHVAIDAGNGMAISASARTGTVRIHDVQSTMHNVVGRSPIR